LVSNEMNCPTCGHSNPFDSVFCTQCATRLTASSTPVDPSAARAAPTYTTSPYVMRSNGVAVLVLGILSLVVCSLLGPIAWSMGKSELERIRTGVVAPDNYGITNAGYICGIIGTALFGLTLLWFLVVLGFGASLL